MVKANFFLIGCQKTASTWIYKSLEEHPEVNVSDKDAIHYFTINYYRGDDWYEKKFTNKPSAKVTIDTTPSYYRDLLAPQRIKNYNPNAKLIISLRNPIDRAFSHYWHEKKKGTIKHNFEDALLYSGHGNYDLFNNWIESGYYHKWISNFLNHFDRSQILFLKYEDLKIDAKAFYKKICDFMEVDASFEPTTLTKSVNKAGKPAVILKKENTSFVSRLKNKLLNKNELNVPVILNEYEMGIKQEVREILSKIYKEENEKLATLTKLDLSDWQ